MSCSVCLREKPVVARQMCNACYQRWHKTGSTEYQKWGRVVLCSLDGCNKKHRANGLCGMHLSRLKKHGDVNNAGPEDWGAKTKHPLYNAWAHLKRFRSQHPVAPDWDDFLTFVLDVGERPDPKAKLFVADDTKPIGPGNFVWKMAITQKVHGEDRKTYLARIQKVYRAVRKEAFQEYDLKRHYGISKKQYDELADTQAHRCAICLKPEGSVIKGRPIKLAVDHCHDTGKVRGLLCSPCNRALGGFQDSPEILKRAILYLGSEPCL